LRYCPHDLRNYLIDETGNVFICSQLIRIFSDIND
jgi:hypothetical protein